MKLKEFCSVYIGQEMILYFPDDKIISINTHKQYDAALKEYGEYNVRVIIIHGYKMNNTCIEDFTLSISLYK